jgi:hypothetical protein
MSQPEGVYVIPLRTFCTSSSTPSDIREVLMLHGAKNQYFSMLFLTMTMGKMEDIE